MRPEDPPPGYVNYLGRHLFNFAIPERVNSEIAAEEHDKRMALDIANQATEVATKRDEFKRDYTLRGSLRREAELKEAEQKTIPERWESIKKRDADLVRNSKLRYRVFEIEEASSMNGKAGDKDEADRFQKLHDALLAIGSCVRTVAMPDADALQNLWQTNPTFRPVTEFFQQQVTLQKKSRKPIRMQPVLISGPPGIGKTHYVDELTRAMGSTVHVERLESDIIKSFALGSSSHWGNTKHGCLFSLLALGKHANPIVVLEEIDKAQSNTYGNATSALYGVLEPISAKNVRDVSLDFTMDASLVTWIATSNDARHLDGPLRSRFREFVIAPPTGEHALAVAREVMLSAIRSAGIHGFSESTKLSRLLAHLTAREIQQHILDAISKAVLDGRTELELGDLPESEIADDDLPRRSNTLH